MACILHVDRRSVVASATLKFIRWIDLERGIRGGGADRESRMERRKNPTENESSRKVNVLLLKFTIWLFMFNNFCASCACNAITIVWPVFVCLCIIECLHLPSPPSASHYILHDVRSLMFLGRSKRRKKNIILLSSTSSSHLVFLRNRHNTLEFDSVHEKRARFVFTKSSKQIHRKRLRTIHIKCRREEGRRREGRDARMNRWIC